MERPSWGVTVTNDRGHEIARSDRTSIPSATIYGKVELEPDCHRPTFEGAKDETM